MQIFFLEVQIQIRTGSVFRGGSVARIRTYISMINSRGINNVHRSPKTRYAGSFENSFFDKHIMNFMSKFQSCRFNCVATVNFIHIYIHNYKHNTKIR